MIGKPLWRCTRAGDMACFQFGNRRMRKSFQGEDCEIGDYALHVRCSWRIIRGDEIVVARQDLYEPDEFDKSETHFDWQKANLQNGRLKKLFVDGTRHFAVVGTALRAAGNLDILFDDEMRLEIFPDSSVRDTDREHWRLFSPSLDPNLTVTKSHIVYSGSGLRYE